MVSTFVSNVGAIVVNLAKRGLIVRVSVEESMLSKDILNLQLTYIKKGVANTIKEAIAEEVVTEINDISVICDALYNKVTHRGN